MTTLADTHTHFHDCFRLPAVLEAVWRRVDGARALHPHDGTAACLVSTEISSRHPLALLKRGAGDLSKRWKVEVAGEPESLVFERDGEPTIAVVPGRQFATREGLEILALATSARFDAGHTLGSAVQAILDEGGVPVVPWGFGKWTFGRRRTLENLFGREEMAQRVFLADAGCRPQGLGRPRPLARAAERGLRVLAGSDPFPFRDHETRVASYGSLLPDDIDWQGPCRWLRDRLQELPNSPAIFGSGSSLRFFLRDQIRIRRRGKLAA